MNMNTISTGFKIFQPNTASITNTGPLCPDCNEGPFPKANKDPSWLFTRTRILPAEVDSLTFSSAHSIQFQGMASAKITLDELIDNALTSLEILGSRGDFLREITHFILKRNY